MARNLWMRSLALTFVCGFGALIQGTVFIFDMEGVLVRRSIRRVIWEVGPLNFIGLFNHLRLDDLVLDFLDQIVPYDNSIPEVTHNGRRMSAFLVLWLQGKLSHAQAIELIEKAYTRLRSAVDSSRKIALVKEIAVALVTPDRFARMMEPVPKGVKLLKKCYRSKHSDGSKKNRIFILTNWDSDSFKLMLADSEFSDFLDMCDGIMVSADVQLVKPQKEIFENLFERFDIDPENELTVYIDDNPQNILAAQKLGLRLLRPMLCKNFNFKSIKKKLKDMEVF